MYEQINFDTLCDVLQSYKHKKMVITFHSMGDRDSIGSAVALSE